MRPLESLVSQPKDAGTGQWMPASGQWHRTESGVVRAVMQYLQLESRVAEVRRQNGGAISAEHNGKKRYIQFVRDVSGKPVVVLDLAGYLVDGRGFELECKVKLPKPETVDRWRCTAPSKLGKEATRYLAQEARVAFLRRINAVSGFVTNVGDAKRIIDAAFKVERAA